MIECNLEQCRKRYIGETERQLKNRIGEHKGYINKYIISQPTGEHFNLPGHSVANMNVTILEKSFLKMNKLYRKEPNGYYFIYYCMYYYNLLIGINWQNQRSYADVINGTNTLEKEKKERDAGVHII
jgi:hypothetical protein